MESSSSIRKFHSICIFGGGNHGNDACFTEAAHNLGRSLGEKCIHIVYGGGSLGLMGRAAASAYMEGVKVVGISRNLWLRVKLPEQPLGMSLEL
ncbi:hypothetical protein OROMI_002861 [Orobanche minor]